MYNNNYNARVVPEFMVYGGTPVGIPTGAVPQNATGGAIPQWALGQQNQDQSQPQSTTQFAQNNTQANDGTTATMNYSLYGRDFTPSFINNMLQDNRFQDIMAKRTSINEGGYADHHNDRGGPTNFGISSRWYPNEDIKNLTPERASALLYRDYWLNPKINQLPNEFADIVFDDGVVQGQPTAIKNLQKALGVKADGIIGSNTLNAFNNADYDTVRKKFIDNVLDVEEQYLINDPSQKVFEQGHKNRFNQY